jgi:hypothetical protein
MDTVILGFLIAGAVLQVISIVLHLIAPFTKTKVDDELVVLLDKAKDMDIIGHLKTVIINALASAQASAKVSLTSAPAPVLALAPVAPVVASGVIETTSTTTTTVL